MTEESLPVAAIDVGTNTALLLVARRGADGGLEVLEDRSVTARLGEGLAATGRLDAGARERTRTIVAGLVERALELGVPRERCHGVGTAVFRRAADGVDFAEELARGLELDFRIASEAQEAQLGHRAVAAESGADTVVVDVGGGSTELVSGGGATRLSAPIGALVLTEKHLAGGLAAAEARGWSRLEAEVRNACERFPEGTARGSPVVCIGGTATNLAALVKGLPRFEWGGLEGTEFQTADAMNWARRMARMDAPARRSLPVEADRIEILPAGLACLGAALLRVGAENARISLRGLRYGLAAERL